MCIQDILITHIHTVYIGYSGPERIFDVINVYIYILQYNVHAYRIQKSLKQKDWEKKYEKIHFFT